MWSKTGVLRVTAFKYCLHTFLESAQNVQDHTHVAHCCMSFTTKVIHSQKQSVLAHPVYDWCVVLRHLVQRRELMLTESDTPHSTCLFCVVIYNGSILVRRCNKRQNPTVVYQLSRVYVTISVQR